MFNKKHLILLTVAISHPLHCQSIKNVISAGDIIIDSNHHSHESIQGSGNIQSENRTSLIENKKINTIAAASCINAIIKENKAPYFMSVTSDDNILPHLKTEMQNETLKLYFTPGSYTLNQADVTIHIPYNVHQYNASGTALIETSSETPSEKSTVALAASGCSKIIFNQPCRKMDELTANTSGTSTIHAVTNAIEKVTIHSSGTSKVRFAPRAKDVFIHYLFLKASGTSKVNLSSMKIGRCKANLSGISTLYTPPIESKDITISRLAKHIEVND